MSAKKARTTVRRVGETLAADAPLSEESARLAWAAPQVTPPKEVKMRLLARIRDSRATPATPSGWSLSSLTAQENWVTLPFPGVRMREVSVDDERDTALVYVEMSPGAVFPDHVHSAKERGVVLSGDLQMGEMRLHAGDYYEAAAGTPHERITSSSGCTGLLWVGARAWHNWRRAMADALDR